MRITPAIGLINTAALLVAVGVSLDLVLRRRRSSELWALISTGVALGAIGVVSIMNQWSFGSVITSDSRPSVILSLGGLFFGPVPTVIAVTIIGVFRVYIGGAGIWVGLGVILTSGAIGLLWRYYRRTRLGEISRIELLSFGLVVHTGTILCMFSLSAEHVNGVISNMSFPLLIIYPAATVLLGSLLSDQLAYRQVQKALEESEEKYRLLADGAMEGIIVIQDGVLRFVNPRAAQMVGYAELELLDTPFVNFIYPDDRETILSQNYQQLKGESLPSRRSIRFLTRDGAQKFVEIDSGMITWDKRPAILAFLKDITERVTIEKALRESEERYRTVADFTYDWECWVDCQDNFLYVSPSCERITGYTAREFIDDPDLMNQIIHPDDRTQMLHHACDVRRVIPHTVDANDFRIIRRDGETRWIGHVCQPVYGQEGQPLGKRCSNRDITERKRAEEELRRSESRLRRAELVAGFGNWELDLSTRRVTTSNGARQIYGLGRQVEWTFDHIKKFSLPEYRSQLDEALLALIKNGAPYDIEFEIRRANDNQVINIHSIAHHDREKDLVFGTIHDITNLRRAEQSRRLLFTAIEQAAEGIIITDAAGIIQYVNPAQEILSGYSRNELLGQTPGIFKSDERDDNFHSNLWETIKAGKVWTGRFVNKKKAGTKYHEAATVSPVYDKSGNLTNFVVVEHDVTTQLQLQEQLFQAQKMEAIGTLAGEFAHDFNNKLQVIAGYVELILLKKDLPETLKQDLGVIRQTTDSSAELIRRMMVFSRKTPIELQPIELNKLVTQASSMLGRSIPKMIEMDVLLADDLWTINGDKIQIAPV
ncbi:MAG: PAS domain S-box protein, partial [Deltaproteobacteria bacterium]|nr:PAS domain S-box protein [Deltaproteobacteria bacterium]